MTALTEFIPVAVSDSIGSSDGRLRGMGMTSALITAGLRAEPKRLASLQLLRSCGLMSHETQAKPQAGSQAALATAAASAPADESGADPVLAVYRKSIDNIDAAIIHMLAERFRITQAVGEYKAKVTLPPADPDREKRQIARLRALSEAADLDPEFSEKFLRFIIDEVIRHHESARDNQ
jgi:chorismate mutase